VHVPPIRLAAALACLLVFGGLAVTPSAHAAITGSQITSPADPSFFVADQDSAVQTFAISGTTTGGSPATDKIAVRCYFGKAFQVVASNVPLSADGSFSIPAANLNTAVQTTCRLRAVPAGSTPTDLTPYSGPVIGVGERTSSTVTGGSNRGKTYDYYFDAQQQTAAFDYVSLSGCGVLDGYLYDSTQANTTITFACNGGLLSRETLNKPTRSEVQVDTANAYGAAQAFSINSDAQGLPTLTDTYTVDAATGNVVLHEIDPLVKCPSATYPPDTTSCSSFVLTGVTDNRTITQDHDGHISWISDAFTSTDGEAHALDLLWENDQRFYGAAGNAAQLEYELPGQNGFAKHVAGDTVSLPASVPGTTLIRMGGVADGNMSTGQGAIVYDRPVSAAKFTTVTPFASDFTLQQTGTVPAGGSTRFRFAYIQDYRAANITSLAKTASTAFLNTIAVSKAGRGKGKVTSSPGGISCGKACSHGFGYGTSVTLKARPSKGSRFVRWSGACKGTGRCKITTTANVEVGAAFALRPCVVPNVVGKSLRAAKLALKRRFCSVGKVTTRASTIVNGHVVSQKPKPGKKLKQHARVSLVISKG